MLIRFLRILFMKKRFLPKKGVKHPYHTTDDVMVVMAMKVDGSGCESKNSKDDNDSDGKRLSSAGRYQNTCLRRRHSTKNTNHEGARKH